MNTSLQERLKSFFATRQPLSRLDSEVLVQVAKLRHPAGSFNEGKLTALRDTLGLKYDMQVSRLLGEAKRRGIIVVNVVPPQNDLAASAAGRLRARFPHLKILEVVDTPDDDHEKLMEELGKAAVAVFERLYDQRGRMTLSIGGGQTLRCFVNLLSDTGRRVSFSPIALLTRSAVETVYDSPYLAMVAHWKSQPLSVAHVCAIPPMPCAEGDDIDTKRVLKRLMAYCGDQYMRNKSVREVVHHSFNADVIFLGVSDLTERSRIVTNTYQLFGYDFNRIYKMGGRVDINYSILDYHGRDVSLKIARDLGAKPFEEGCHPFLLAMSPQKLNEMAADQRHQRDIVLVAGAKHKHRCIRAALVGKLVNGLITDSDTVTRLADDKFYDELKVAP